MSREFGASPFTLFAPSTLGNDANTVYTATVGVGEFIIPMIEKYTITEVGLLAQNLATLPGSGFKCKFVRRMGGVHGSGVAAPFAPAALGSQTITQAASISTNVGGVPTSMIQSCVTGELDLILFTAPVAVPNGLAQIAITTAASTPAVPTPFAGFTAATVSTQTIAPQVLPASIYFAAAGTSGSQMTNSVPNWAAGTCLRAYTNAPMNKGDLLVCKVTAAGGASSSAIFYAKGFPGGAGWVEPADTDSN